MRLTPVQNPPELTSSKTPLRLKTAPFLHLVSALLTSNLLFSVLASSGLFAATAPDSIAGKVYRDSFFSTAQRMYGEATILFGSDSRFVYLKEADASTDTQRAGSGAELRRPPGDGQFTYARTGESAGTIALNFDHGTNFTMNLSFTTASTGQTDRFPSASGRPFSLSDLSTVQSAPTANVSLRGRVTPG